MSGVNLKLNRVPPDADVESVPLNENFVNLENGVNDLQHQFDEFMTPVEGAEVVNARDYHPSLRSRLRSASQLIKRNVLIAGGEVTVDTDVSKVNIAEGEAVIAGTACKWPSVVSAAIPPSASGNHRVDLVVFNSDNSVSIILGNESLKSSTDPALPGIASSQLSRAVLYVDDTDPVDLTGLVFPLKEDDPFFPNVFIKQDRTFTEDKNFNNLIVLGCAIDTGANFLLCQGRVYIKNVSSSPAPALGEFFSNASQYGKSTSSVWTLVNIVGSSLHGTSGGYIPVKGAQNIQLYKGNPGAVGKSIKIKARSIYISGGFENKGGKAAHGQTNTLPGLNGWSTGESEIGAFGGDGGIGGAVHLEALEEILQAGDIDVSGGESGDGKDANAGSIGNLAGNSGNGGDGGSIVIKCKAYVSSGSLVSNGGLVGVHGTGSGGSNNNANGVPGTVGNPGTQEVLEWDFSQGLPKGYAEWIREIAL